MSARVLRLEEGHRFIDADVVAVPTNVVRGSSGDAGLLASDGGGLGRRRAVVVCISGNETKRWLLEIQHE